MPEKDNKKELQEFMADMLSLNRDEQMKAWGFALGLKAQEEHHPG